MRVAAAAQPGSDHMSMEMHVLFRGKLPSKAALTRAMKELGFPFSIAPPGGALEQQTGFMPMRFRRDESGVEFDVFDGRADVEDVAGDRVNIVDQRFDRSANFRWGGDENEMLAGKCAAAALAKLVNGIVVEDEEGLLLSVDEAIGFARKHLQAIAKPQRPGTRPADIKRYLKPLLKLRGDLALVGRLLVARPVRHLLRGAYFEPFSKHRFRIWSHTNPLYAPAATTYGDYFHVGDCAVWEPHFGPLLMDALAEDVFAQVGRITTLDEFAAQSFDKTPFLGAKVISLVLAGAREQAAEYVEEIEHDDRINGYAKNLVRDQWARVSGNIETVCAEFHAKEAATIKALKLEHVWEPSPFPCELPVAERVNRSAEPPFSPAPWTTKPEWLLSEAPSRPGEVAFAKEIHIRDGRVVMQVPITPEKAEDRHREREHYAFAVRLSDTLLYTARFLSLWDRNDPERYDLPPDRRTLPELQITLRGPSYVVWASVRSPRDDESLACLGSIEVRDTHESIWHYRPDREEEIVRLHDARTGEQVFSKTPLSPVELELLTFPRPPFGEYADLVARIRSLLRYAGYGELK
jgi:hypothetical protein